MFPSRFRFRNYPAPSFRSSAPPRTRLQPGSNQRPDLHPKAAEKRWLGLRAQGNSPRSDYPFGIPRWSGSPIASIAHLVSVSLIVLTETRARVQTPYLPFARSTAMGSCLVYCTPVEFEVRIPDEKRGSLTRCSRQ